MVDERQYLKKLNGISKFMKIYENMRMVSKTYKKAFNLRFLANSQGVSPLAFLVHTISVRQVDISAAESHLLAAGLRLVRHLTLHVGGVTATHLTHYTQ